MRRIRRSQIIHRRSRRFYWRITIPRSRREKRHSHILMDISALCHLRTSHSNLFQIRMGHYFSCARTPKRPIEVAHQLGISVSYSSIATALVATAMSVKEAILSMSNLSLKNFSANEYLRSSLDRQCSDDADHLVNRYFWFGPC